MKILLVALNAKYVHTNLAIHCLKAVSPEHNTFLKEFTINESSEFILSSLYQEQADLVAFSCYIWNIEKILEIAGALRKVMPQVRVALGGPEVSYEVQELLTKNPFVDFIIIGEGELVFKNLVSFLQKKEPGLVEIPGLAFRKDKEIQINKPASVSFDWTTLPSPFLNQELGDYYQGKSLYYETSRGCPFTCSYCLSGHHGKSVKFLPLERVKEEIAILAESGAKQIKFVDRTFNCNKKRSLKIWQYILNLRKGINYHFEISADLLDDETLQFLKNVPAGLFNFEIGIQTTQEETMSAIYRKSSIPKAFPMIKQLLEETKVTVYLDLIVGLPYESYEKFKNSFDQVLNLRPHKLHMGFLKILKGSQIKQEVNIHGYKYYDQPPYEILENNYLSFNQLITLKRIEVLLERYYNSGRFIQSHLFIHQFIYSSLFDFYNNLRDFWEGKNLFAKAISLSECYEQLYDFIQEQRLELIDDFQEIIRFDYLLGNIKGNLPRWCGYFYTKEDKERHARLVNSPIIISNYLPHLANASRKERINLTHSDYFKVDITSKNFDKEQIFVLFDYSKKEKDKNCFWVISEDVLRELEIFNR